MSESFVERGIREMDARNAAKNPGRLAEHVTFRAADQVSIYVLMCVPYQGQLFVKVGLAGAVYERIPALQTGCPFDFDVVTHAPAGNRTTGYKIESMIHQSLRPYRVSGEWFCFAVGDESGKQAINKALRDAFHEHFADRLLKWSRVKAKDILRFHRVKVSA